MKLGKRVAGFPRLLLCVFLCAALLAACASQPRPPVAEERTLDWWLKHLTVEEKVGQLFWFGLKEPGVSAEAEALVRAGRAGGFIYFSRQSSDPVILKTISAQLQGLTRQRERATPGLIISVDQEGGLVQRFAAPNFTPWPGNMAVGATGSEAFAEQVAAAIASELKAVGINMNLGPAADVNNNPANPVIGIRSYGEDPKAVARLSAAAVKGSQAGGVSAVAKHFPGHGDTDVDSHKAMPTVTHAIERLEQVELIPFRATMEAGVDAVMAAHVLFPAVAKDGLPATLSGDVLTGLLKGKLAYKGLVITDAMDTMKAITDNWGLDKALILAVQAGVDALLVTDSFGRQLGLYESVLGAVKAGQITEERLNDAVRRNLALKEKLGLLPRANTVAAEPVQATAPNLEANKQLAYRIGAEALTLVRNQHLPLKLNPDQSVLVLAPSYGGGTALGAGIRAHHPAVIELAMDRKPSAAAMNSAREKAAGAAVIVYGMYNGHKYPEHQTLLKELAAAGKPVIVVGMGEPYELTAMPQIGTYIAAYGYQASNLQGVGALLFGKAAPTGRLPVSIPGLYPIGHGLAQ